jgi:hypothetical protein
MLLDRFGDGDLRERLIRVTSLDKPRAATFQSESVDVSEVRLHRSQYRKARPISKHSMHTEAARSEAPAVKKSGQQVSLVAEGTVEEEGKLEPARVARAERARTGEQVSSKSSRRRVD